MTTPSTTRFLLFSGKTIGYHLVDINSLPFPTAVNILKPIEHYLNDPLIFSMDVLVIEDVLTQESFFDWYSQYGKRVFRGKKVELIAVVHQLPEIIGISLKTPQEFQSLLKQLIKRFITETISLSQNSSFRFVFNQD